MTIVFKSITLRNFLSYGNVPTTIVLDRNGTTLVLGEDLDNTSSGTGANGVGKEQTLSSSIKTPSGWIKMGDICVGQTVQTPNGQTATVTGVFPQGIKPVYKLTFSDGRTTEAGKEHLWKVFSHRWGKSGARGEKIVTTLELIKYLKESEKRNYKPWYNIFIPVIKHIELENKPVPIDPYLLGVLLGDGAISTGTGVITSSDSELIKRCQETIHRDHGQQLILQEHKNSTGYDWCIRNPSKSKPTLKSCLKQLGLYGHRSNSKFIPPEYKEGTSKQQKLELLAGLLDTDGTVGKTKNVSFCSVSEQLAKDVQYLIRSLGGKATLSTRTPFYTTDDGTRIEGQLAYNVSIRYSNPNKLFHLERKRSRLSSGDTQYANEGLRLISIDRVKDQECQCIMIDHPDHLYITDDFIVTHNSVLLNALAYVIYDKPISNISKDNLVNNINKRNMEVSLDFEKGGNSYRIVRARKMKAGAAGNYVIWYENGEDKTPDSVGNTTKRVEQIIGIPYELFVRIAAFSATHVPFLDLPLRSHYAANQTDIIEELFDLKTLSEKAELLKAEIKATEQSLDLQLERAKQLEKVHERHKEQVKSAKKRIVDWEEKNKNEITQIKEKLKRIEEVDVDHQRILHDELTSVDNQLRESLEDQRLAERKLKNASKKIKEKKKELGHLRDAKCPYCSQAFKDTAQKIEEAEQENETAEEIKAAVEPELVVIDERVEQLASRHKKVKSEITVSDLDSLLEVRSSLDHYRARLKELQEMENPYLDPLEELETAKLEPIKKGTIDKLTNKIDHQKFLLKLLTKKDSFVRKTLLNKNIPFLNQRLAHYLVELGLPHTVEFTHEMTARITQFGRVLDFGNLSSGQKARVNLALSFSFRDVLQSMHEHINVCMLDEVLDVGLDTVGVQSAARMLKHKARDEGIAIYIISHRDEIDSAFDRKMIIQMSKGFSSIKFED